jgi:hypothetical protein
MRYAVFAAFHQKSDTRPAVIRIGEQRQAVPVKLNPGKIARGKRLFSLFSAFFIIAL